MPHFPKLGILGGGQLGQMLIQSAINFGLDIAVLDPDSHCPCHAICTQFTQGSLMDFDTVYTFGRQVDVVTIEFEHVNTEALLKLQSEGVLVYPQPQALAIIQDKGLQKQFYLEHNIPTAPFYLIQSQTDLHAYLHFFPAVLKTRTQGYDGKGVCTLATEADIQKSFDGPCVLEKKVSIDKEFALSIARNPQGDIQLFPAVDLYFHPKVHMLDYLICPAQLSDSQLKEAQSIAKKIVSTLNFVGLLAIEFFLCQNGEILVNEIAPRPHNSGHHSIEGLETSQFDQVIRAILNLPLSSTKITHPSAMVNLLDSDREININALLALPSTYVHWYGKKSKKAWRKLGHVTVLAPTVQDLDQKINAIKDLI